MNRILVATAIVLLPFAISTTAWADSAQTTQAGAASLDTQPAAVTETSEDEADRLNGLASQINQSIDGRPQQSEDMPSVNELLNLPEDTVVRGTRGGGLAIGTEF